MLDFLRHGNRRPRSETFGQLTIEKRVLITPKSTISIPNIAAIASGTIKIPSRPMWALVLALLVGGAGVLAYGTKRTDFTQSAAGVAMAIAGLVLARYFAHTEKPCLFISSSDGHTAQFTGQAKTLEETRRLLSEKINADDESAVYRVHFDKGLIHTVHARQGASILAAMQGPATHIAAGPPGLQLGNGHYPAGSGYHADYAQVLPNIVEMQRFYAQRPDTHDIADRLSELEHLMRSGTPTPASRGRLSQLLGDLSTILGAYPGVVQVFQQAARIAGV
jgi:hypothetical protein